MTDCVFPIDELCPRRVLLNLLQCLVTAGGLEMARRYGQWDREGYWRHKP